MKDADHKAGEATGTGVLDAEGQLSDRGGRVASRVTRPIAPASFRLKRSVDLFAASDGSLYLLRSGSAEDFVVSCPSQRDRLLLERLSKGYVSETELVGACEMRGMAAGRIGSTLLELEELGILERESPQLLNTSERERFDRQLIYFAELAAPGLTADQAQRNLAKATVVILGCGGLGSWTACGLACAGVGTLVLVDDDHVELSNLNRQLLFDEADVGRPKVEAAQRALLAHSSGLEVRLVKRRIGSAGDLADVLQDADLLIEAADWPPFELPRWVNQACLEANVPHIGGGQYPPLSRIGPMVVPGRSACVECLEQDTRRNYPHYAELADFRTAHPVTAAAIGPASGIIGSILAMEAIHLLSGVCQPTTIDTVLILDLRTMTVTREEVRRDPDCAVCGVPR